MIEEILGNTVKAYFVALLLGICRKQNTLQEIMDEPSVKQKRKPKDL
jgi:hypothetical protein